MKDYHHVLLVGGVVLLDTGCIVFEVIMEFQVINGEERHGGIEVFFVLVEVELHDSEVVLQLC